MASWQVRTRVETDPERVVELLSDPASYERWSPVPLELERLDGERLSAGRRGRVVAGLAGRGVGFDLHVVEADARHMAVRASGPFEVEALYEALPRGSATELWTSVSLRAGEGMIDRLLRRAADAVLASGALDAALSRFAREAEVSTPA
jgi:hypothetical protein